MARAAVLGIGNVLQGDDGVGVAAVREIEVAGLVPGCDTFDGGTAPFDMMSVFLDYDLVVVIDAVRAGRRPGTVYRLTPDALDDSRTVRFAHGLGVSDTVRVARELGSQARVVVIGVEPKCIDWSLDLSDEVRASMGELVFAVRREVRGLQPEAVPMRFASSE